MNCLRCGYCCNRLSVVIVSDPEVGLSATDPIPSGVLEIHRGMGPGPCPCKYLKGSKPGEFSCEIHDKPWYKNTPCFQYDQIGEPDDNCRMGEAVLSGNMCKLAKEYNLKGWQWWVEE